MHNKVFISYAKEDFDFAEKLYNYLEDNDFRPWLDKKSILPGQDWNFTLRKALREANYIILLLSNTSVQKRGYIQREFKLALDYYEEKLEDDIYLIPLKISECEIPESLSKFQWIDFIDDNSFNLVYTSLSFQREKYYEYERKQIAAKELFQYEEITEQYEYSNKIKFSIDIGYFKFIDESNPNLRELNQIVLGSKVEETIRFRKLFHKSSGKLISISKSERSWMFDISYIPNYISKSIVSINQSIATYTGGIHGDYYLRGLNYHVNPVFEITLEDLFDNIDHFNILEFLSTYCFEELKKNYNEWLGTPEDEITNQRREDLFWENSLDPDWKNFKHYFLSKTGIEIIFNTYSVSSYAFGLHIIPITYEKLIPLLKKPKYLRTIIEKINY